MNFTVDAHCHVWDWTRWRPAVVAHRGTNLIRRRFALREWRASARQCAVDQCVLIQAVGDTDETRDLLSLAASDAAVLAVVGWVDLRASRIDETLALLQAGLGGGKLAGVRPLLHLESHGGWLRERQVLNGIEAVGKRGLGLEFVLNPVHWQDALRVARSFPRMRFVLDHMGGPVSPREDWRAWRVFVGEASQVPNVWCKISGEGGWEAESAGAADHFACAVKHCLQMFGWRRLLWGSDWPVCLLQLPYTRAYSDAGGALVRADWASVLSANARRAYGVQ